MVASAALRSALAPPSRAAEDELKVVGEPDRIVGVAVRSVG